VPAKQPDNTVQVGAYVPVELAKEFRQQCQDRRFFKQRVIERVLRWWLDLPEDVQARLYHDFDLDAARARFVNLDEFRQMVSKAVAEQLGSQPAPEPREPKGKGRKP
jgi:hypothetical protein